MEHIITGIDIGSNSIKLAVGKKEEGYINIIGAVEVPSEGISKGAVNSLEEVVSCVATLRCEAEKMTGMEIEDAYVGISGPFIVSQNSRGVVAVAKAEGEITQDDVNRVVSSAKAVAAPHNYSTLKIIPREYIVDGQGGIRDPNGMTGIRLEIDALLIQCLAPQQKSLVECVQRADIDISDINFSIIGTAEAVLTKRQKDLGVCLVNIGQSTTTMIVYEDDNVLTTAVLNIGSRHITSDLAICLRTSIDIAEAIKIKYGIENDKSLEKKDYLNLSDFDVNNSDKISKKEIKDVIEARVEELFGMVDKELNKINRKAKLPAGIIITGGGAKLKGIVEVAKKVCKLPAEIGVAQNINSSIDKVNDPAFSTAIGMVMYGDKMQEREFYDDGKKGGNFIKKILKKIIPSE